MGEVVLDPPCLVVDVVVCRVVAGEDLEGVPGEVVAAVVVHSLDGRQTEEESPLAKGHAGDQEGEARAEGVEKEALEGVVVQRAVCVGDVKAVVSRVKLGWLTLAREETEKEEQTYCTSIG